jgi:histidine triad (HIT) family protein
MDRKTVTALLIIGFVLVSTYGTKAQSAAYELNKAKSIAEKSVFEKIVNRELPATILYEDEAIMAFIPLRKQAPIHILIIPKKRIVSINEITNEDALLIGKMFIVARDLAKEYKIDQSGYRLSINTNEDAGQSVFHLHMHLLGGKELGPITTQDYTDPGEHRH